MRTASNEDYVWHLFDKVLFLNIDEKSLKERIAARTDNEYGHTEYEIDLIMDKYRADMEKRDLTGVIVVDATQSVDQVVERILSEV